MLRSIRRHHRARLKEKRKRYWGYPRRWKGHEEEMSDHHLGMVVTTPHPCSCWMCCNERRIEGSPISERRHSEEDGNS
jgi:hypothetical protein